MGYTVYFNAADLGAAGRKAHQSWAQPRNAEEGMSDIAYGVIDEISLSAVPLGDLGYSSHSGDDFREWLAELSTQVGVDLSQLWYREEFSPWGFDLDYPSLGGLSRDEISTVLEQLRSMESADQLDDPDEELLILLERAHMKSQDLVTWAY